MSVQNKNTSRGEAVSTEQEVLVRRGKLYKRVFRSISNLIFYTALALMFFASISWGRGINDPIFIFNHTMIQMMTDSMEPDIPASSLIIVQRVSPEELAAGDVITFAVSQSRKETHQIINIWPDYLDGQIGFQTAGINQVPDDTIILEGSVLGRVVHSIPRLGSKVMFIPELITEPQNIGWVFLVFFVMIAISCYLWYTFSREKRENHEEQKNPTEEG